MNTRWNAMVGSRPSLRGMVVPPTAFKGKKNETCLSECFPIRISWGGKTAKPCSTPLTTRFSSTLSAAATLAFVSGTLATAPR